MLAVLSSNEGVLAASVYAERRALGLSSSTLKVAAVGAATLTYPDDFDPNITTLGCGGNNCDHCGNGPGGSNDFGGDGCTSSSNKCLGCCGIGCWGCTGVCTQACLDHDCCQRANGAFSCLGGLMRAIGSFIHACL